MNKKGTEYYLQSTVAEEAIKCDCSWSQEPEANLEVERYPQQEALTYRVVIKRKGMS